MATVERTWIFVAAAAAGVLFAGLLAAMAITGDGGRVALVAVVLWVGGYLLVSRFLRASRRPAVEAEARRLGLSFSRRDPFRVLDSDFHPFLHFGKLPGTQGVENVVWGERAGREMRAFEYWRPAEDEPIRYSCAMVRIPEEWPSLLVRRKGPLDVARERRGAGRAAARAGGLQSALRDARGRWQACLGGGRPEDDGLVARVGSGARVPAPARLAARVDATPAAAGARTRPSHGRGVPRTDPASRLVALR